MQVPYNELVAGVDGVKGVSQPWPLPELELACRELEVPVTGAALQIHPASSTQG